jgi:hypothetical protein
VEKLPADIRDQVKPGGLPTSIARELVSLPDDDAKRDIARRYLAGELKRAEVTAAVRLAKSGNAGAAPASIVCEAAGVNLRLDLAAGQGLKEAEAAIREMAKDLSAHRKKTVAAFREFLQAKALARKKAVEHQAAEEALAGHVNHHHGKEITDA